ncbi:L-threonylcarbamoyladenylate synthase [Albimonas sp. CAU 1670]|uniref:L-threonylcarbamoyladenylate synthase n=1 Tax=Albimonas sp. CAU 1670 TaxID=3032599 RepID=UPI0023DC08B4|nr:L-threonylcarbamoyladenylate synthase [Albimonas sp. CAU 1670]MDF2233340.1 L-threonylcarbamoyladenylate synthase [Albimonas sp. CAU 1670]
MSAGRPADDWPERATERLAGDPAGVARAAAILREGGLVAFPTETVYGLGGRADRAESAAGIYAAKGRPSFNPLIAHVPDLAAAERLAVFPEAARALAQAFWPGPLTLVLPRRPDAELAPAVTAGLPTVAIRVPAHPLARALLAATGAPVAAPSANRSGKVSPTTADHVAEGLGGRIDAILDGGPCPVGVESTILGFEGETPVLLRPGGLALETIAATCGAWPAGEGASSHGQAPAGAKPALFAPGMLASHYAPGAALRLNAEAPRAGEGWLGFGPGPEAAGPALNLSPAGDPAEAAANLFAHLRTLDAAMGGAGTIAVAPVPEAGLGLAVNDRLRRAAAPRADPLADPFADPAP